MKWIVSSDPEVFVDATHMQARLQYIHSVTDVSVTEWFTTQKSSALPKTFFIV